MLKSIKGWKKYILIYVAALVLSHLITNFFQSPLPEQEEANKTVQLNIVNPDQSLSDKDITIGYQDIYSGSEDNPPVLLLLPGGPEGPEVFQEIIPDLSSKMRVIIPHLPGYGSGNDNLPSYSFETSSVYTSQFLDTLNISTAHVFGFGLGGPSAIHLAHDHPNKIKSVGLIASVGVQELELLGSYRLNHAVHGLQLGAVWLLHNAVPHFGLFEAIDIDVSYAKRHYESDQRPLRSYLKQLRKPMIILHGKKDPLVPLAAAQEHHRIVPQSELQLYEADHDLLETHSDSVSQAINSFITEVEQGTATTADNASKERIKEAEKSFSNVEFAKFEGVSLLIIMVIIILGTLISEDLTCIGAGLLVARGLIGFWPATLACFLGIFIGDVGLYLAGRVLGRPAIKRAPFKWFISEKDLEKSAQWFKVKGPAIIIATRFLPGSRMPTYFSAGVIRAGFWMFIFYFILAGLVWTPMLVGISKLLGNELLRYFELYQDYAIWVFLGAVAFIIMFIKLIIPAFSYKGRRLLLSRYRKLTRWQYWWPIIIYTPVTLYIIYLGIKYRCLTLFTAVNPAIPDGGFVGESKSAILDLFKDSSSVASFKRISFDEEFENMLDAADEFLKENEMSFPVVLKPDVGERGKGVSIIKDRHELQDYLSECSEDIIIQEFVEGKEVGIFYYRKPQEEEGHIFSITKKELPQIVGDGKKTVQELILSDDLAVNMGKEYLKQNEDRLFEIPAEKERITLVDIGTHARGAVFFDGKELITEALSKRMNEICKSARGFYFGRFDIKVPDYEQLKDGKGLKIVEVNGVTSESTNIYDDRFTFIEGQNILMNQWQIAFEIGDQLRNNGREVTSLYPFLKRIFNQLVKTKE
ncbi:alpha/beta fold hydrolase [Fodinibius sp.]|uniref:alpha/beta fold hydrolase n=1 Tax=Fodinibius sp. TaxID=1872440 RepID=UPI002ACEA3A1|nr:alpha/beta fold hydrolase [Fodinibius sp.]MDZ7660284.1 alpha/beta fold hydrolase [Fodinibius sp.]